MTENSTIASAVLRDSSIRHFLMDAAAFLSKDDRLRSETRVRLTSFAAQLPRFWEIARFILAEDSSQGTPDHVHSPSSQALAQKGLLPLEDEVSELTQGIRNILKHLTSPLILPPSILDQFQHDLATCEMLKFRRWDGERLSEVSHCPSPSAEDVTIHLKISVLCKAADEILLASLYDLYHWFDEDKEWPSSRMLHSFNSGIHISSPRQRFRQRRLAFSGAVVTVDEAVRACHNRYACNWLGWERGPLASALELTRNLGEWTHRLPLYETGRINFRDSSRVDEAITWFQTYVVPVAEKIRSFSVQSTADPGSYWRC